MICVGENVFGVGFEPNVGAKVEVFQIFEGCSELMSQEIGINLDPVVDFNFQRFDEIS